MHWVLEIVEEISKEVMAGRFGSFIFDIPFEKTNVECRAGQFETRGSNTTFPNLNVECRAGRFGSFRFDIYLRKTNVECRAGQFETRGSK